MIGKPTAVIRQVDAVPLAGIMGILQVNRVRTVH